MKSNEVAAEVAATLLDNRYIPTAYRTCAVCRYFNLDLGGADYGDGTGSYGSISCSHSFGEWGECRYPDESDFDRLIAEAKKCPNFELRKDT